MIRRNVRNLKLQWFLTQFFLGPNASYKSVMVAVLTCKVKMQVIKTIVLLWQLHTESQVTVHERCSFEDMT